MSAHLLPLSALHAAGPGSLEVIFGPDGDFEGAPRWGGPVTIECSPRPAGHAFVTAPVEPDGLWLSTAEGNGHRLAQPDLWPWSPRLALDLRIPSVAARLLSVCFMVPANQRDMIPFSRRQVDALLYGGAFGPWTDRDAAHVASLTLALAPRIAALGGTRD